MCFHHHLCIIAACVLRSSGSSSCCRRKNLALLLLLLLLSKSFNGPFDIILRSNCASVLSFASIAGDAARPIGLCVPVGIAGTTAEPSLRRHLTACCWPPSADIPLWESRQTETTPVGTAERIPAKTTATARGRRPGTYHYCYILVRRLARSLLLALPCCLPRHCCSVRLLFVPPALTCSAPDPPFSPPSRRDRTAASCCTQPGSHPSPPVPVPCPRTRCCRAAAGEQQGYARSANHHSQSSLSGHITRLANEQPQPNLSQTRHIHTYIYADAHIQPRQRHRRYPFGPKPLSRAVPLFLCRHSLRTGRRWEKGWLIGIPAAASLLPIASRRRR